MLDGHLEGKKVLRNSLPADKSRKKNMHLVYLHRSFICAMIVERPYFTMRDASRRKSDRAGPRCQVPAQYVGADILSEWNVEGVRKPRRGLLGSVSRLAAELNNSQWSRQIWLAKLACALMVQLKFPEPTLIQGLGLPRNFRLGM